MRKYFSIFFIVLLLMNVMGYYGIFLGLRISNDVRTETRLSLDSFKDSELLTIRIPVAIPYAADQDYFQPASGKFEHEGEVYHLVKQRFSQDTLSIVCFRDAKGGKINRMLTAYVKSFADHQAPGKSAKVTISFIKDYLLQNFSLSRGSYGWEQETEKSSFQICFTSLSGVEIIYPPEAVTVC